MKNHPLAGGLDDAARARMRARLWEAIGADDPTQAQQTTVQGSRSYIMWLLSQYISKPVVAGAFSLLVMAGGWMTTVRAADSLPGDSLYSVKMMTEKAQLRLASLDQRAVLHTKFAERRVQEAAELQAAAEQKPERASLVKETLEASKQEIASAQQDLKNLKATGAAQTLATATSVQQNLQNLGAALDGVVTVGVTAGTAEEARAVREVTKEASHTATDVVVEVHEEQGSEVTAREVTDLFKETLGEIEARERFNLQRLETIRVALEDSSIVYDGLEVPKEETLLLYGHSVLSVEDGLSEAMDMFARGGYREAFASLKEIDAALLAIEAKIAEIEVLIMRARAQTPPPATEEVECTENCTSGEVEKSEM